MKRIWRRVGIAITAILIAIVALLWITGNEHLFKAIAFTYLRGQAGPDIDEKHLFPFREVDATSPQPWPQSKFYNLLPPSKQELDSFEKYKTTSLLIVRKDSIIFEKYWENYSDTTYSNSFSVAKTVVGLAVGAAIQKGLISSINEKVSTFLPEFNQGRPNDVTIKDLLTMTSGINFNEHYGDPFGFMAKAYYGDRLIDKTLKFSSEIKPGADWHYLGGNTLLLAMIVNEVSGMTLSEFVSENIWSKIGATQDAHWSIDDIHGFEKAFCCYFSNARDFARIGKLYLDSGRWNGEQIIPEWFIVESIQPVKTTTETIPHYGYHIWRLNGESENIFYARGILGQYIMCIPEQDMIVVRLGHQRGNRNELKHPVDVYNYLNFARRFYEQ